MWLAPLIKFCSSRGVHSLDACASSCCVSTAGGVCGGGRVEDDDGSVTGAEGVGVGVGVVEGGAVDGEPVAAISGRVALPWKIKVFEC